MTAPAAIALDLMAAYEAGPATTVEALTRWLAPRVQVLHEPPDPSDGTYDAPTVLAALANRQAVLSRIMPDYREAVTGSSADDTVTLVLTLTGTLPDGQEVRISGTDTLRVQDGRIVTMTSRFAPDAMRPLVTAIQESMGTVKPG